MRRFTTTSLRCDGLKCKISQMEVVKDFESRAPKAVSFLVEREKGDRNGTSRSCRRCYLVTVEEKCPGRSTKEKGREEGEADEDSEER